MAFTYYRSTNYVDLALKLAESIRLNKNVFIPTFIGIAQNATKDYLIEEIIEQNTIAANLAFKSPIECVEIIAQILEIENKKKDVLQLSDLTWLIFHLLNETNFKEKFPIISDYYYNQELKRFTLAEKVAGLFVKYQELDPDLILELENNKTEKPNFDWQGFLWLEIKKQGKTDFNSLNDTFEFINSELKNPVKQELLKSKLEHIAFFGNFIYTKEILETLSLVGEFITIEIYRVDLTVDLQAKNSTSSIVENLTGIQVKQSILFKEISAADVQPSEEYHSKTLLHSLQESLKGKAAVNYEEKQGDDSILIANNYSIYREVEALWNYLVQQFDSDNTLKHKDITVLIPDIKKYAPAISAVFENAKLKFNYSFLNSSYHMQDSPYKALLALYTVEEDEFTSKKIISLLEYKFIREKTGIQDLELIKRAISLANIRHGIEGNENLETHFVSWRYGLKRLIYGACIEQTEEQVTDFGSSFYPVSEFEDRDIYELIRLDQFVETLHQWLMDRATKRDHQAWRKHIDETINLFLEIEEYESPVFNYELEKFSKTAVLSEGKEISFETIRYTLEGLLNGLEDKSTVGYGGIRFVSPNVNLSIPAKVFCFLGLNGTDFPRKDKRLSFDLLGMEKDYGSAALDKNLFLNLLLGAKEKIYISYIGQSSKDNSNIPASTLVDELLDACKKIGGKPENINVKHSLHSFSTKYNDNDEKLYNYLETSSDFNLKTDENKITKRVELEKDKEGLKIVPIADLIRFLQDPIKHFYNNKLKIYYSDWDVSLAEVEPFELGILENWALKNNLLQNKLNNLNVDLDNLDEFVLEKKKKGELPFVNYGEVTLQKVRTDAKVVLDKLDGISLDKKQILKIIQETGEFKLIGNAAVFDSTYLFAVVSSDSFKYQIPAVVNFLALHSDENNSFEGKYITKDTEKSITVPVGADLSVDLQNLCKLYEKGLNEMLYFTSGVKKLSLVELAKYTSKEALSAYFVSISTDGRSSYLLSDYFKKELDDGFFNSQENFEQFVKTYEMILSILNKYLN